MKNLWQNNGVGMARLLMDAANGAGGDGGGGATGQPGGSLLTSPGGGGGSANSTGGTPAGDGTTANGTPPAGAASAGQNPNGGGTTDWRSSLPKELQESAAIRKFTDVSALAGAYVNAEKLIGAKGIPKPGPASTDQDWANVFKELGLPESVDKYEVKFQDGNTLDKAFTDEFKTNAHKAGILPKQAQALADWFVQKNAQALTSAKDAAKSQLSQQVEGLKTEWGKAYDLNLSRAQAVLKDFGNPELVKYLDASGLGNDVNLIKLLAGVGGKMFSEDKFVGGADGAGALTPAQAKQEITKIQTDRNHPYYVKDHPAHKEAVIQMAQLFEAAHGTGPAGG